MPLARRRAVAAHPQAARRAAVHRPVAHRPLTRAQHLQLTHLAPLIPLVLVTLQVPAAALHVVLALSHHPPTQAL